MRLVIIYPFSFKQKIEKKTRASLIKYYIKVNVRGFFLSIFYQRAVQMNLHNFSA